jgi:adenylyl-sulfate kinase
VTASPPTAAGRPFLDADPWERLELLCDPGTVRPLGPTAAGVGVRVARGRVDGRAVVCYAQDRRASGGSVGVAEADAIVAALRRSGAEGAPLVAFIESAGARLQEGTGALDGFGRIFFANVALGGHVPQISVIVGTSAGGGSYSPALTDFVVMTEQAAMFLTGPKVVSQALGEEVDMAALGGPAVHERNGVCHLVARDDGDAAALTRELLGHLPQTSSSPPPLRPPEDPPAADPAAPVPADPRRAYDVRAVVRALVDGGRLLEIAPRWARNMVCGLARLEGRPVGIVANQSRYLGGIIDVTASQKAARFIRTCDAYRLPLLAIVDTPGFMPGTRQEQAGIIRHGAELLRAFAAATVPRATVIVRKAFGGAFITMNSKGLGADAVFAWPAAQLGVMGAQAAVEIIHRRALRDGSASAERLAERYAERELAPAGALRRGAIDEVIEPARTRERVAAVLLRAPARPGGRRVSRPLREGGDMDGCTIWLTGLSGAGKSTVAALVARDLRARGARVEVLDGDVVRRHLSKGLGFSREDRDTNIRRIAFVADLLSRNGVCVIVAAISPYRATRDEARSLMGRRFLEVHVGASLETCAQRDTKGLYAKAMRGEIEQFTGVSDPYEAPTAPEVVLDTERETPEESAAKVLRAVAARAIVGEAAA